MHLKKRVLVTGGAGFLGRHLVKCLLAQGNDVLCVDNFFTSSRDNVVEFLGNPDSAHDAGCPVNLLKAVEDINDRQKFLLLEKASARFGGNLKGRTFAVWGLSFKPNTDDIREAPALTLIRGLLENGAFVRAYDPEAMPNAQTLGGLPAGECLFYAPDKYSVLNGAEALFLMTEWKDFRSPDFMEMKARLKTPLIFDGRNQYNAKAMKAQGIEYHQVGVPTQRPKL